MYKSAETIVSYHQRTKHQLNAYAKGPESLDWDDQPNPYRRYIGCEIISLPLPGAELPCLFSELDKAEHLVAQPLTIGTLGLMLELALGLSAWKQFGPDRWALRCNPSSGNLHPTEAYLLCTAANVLPTGVYHYVSYEHSLECRSRFTADNLPAELYLGVSSIHWREAWKYGERAFRYCQHDVGHALAALSYAAACFGWTLELCSEAADAEIAAWLGLDRSEEFVAHEHEVADLFCRINTSRSALPVFNADALSKSLLSAEWFGKAQRLSGRHFYRWPVIDEVSVAAQKPKTAFERFANPSVILPSPSQDFPASQLIRQRRSAQQFDGKAEAMPLADFQRIVSALLPNAKPPFSAWNWSPQVHILLFVHRVQGLEPGLYLLPRDQKVVPELQTALSKDFSWQTISVPCLLYLLTAGNVRQAAKTLSCHQPIASDSAFSLGMLVRFAENIEHAAWLYRRLFWECGLLGQILYLEAEAAGFRGTGIGCFFDDAVHGVLGLQNDEWQSLYHFTVGTPLDDGRLQTFGAYEHLRAAS